MLKSVFVDGHFLDGKKHGVAVLLEKSYEEFALQNPNVSVVVGLESGSLGDYGFFELPNVTVVRYRVGGGLRFFLDIPLMAIKYKPDVIHTQYFLPIRLFYKALRHVSIHDVLFEDFPEFYKFSYRLPRKIMFRVSAKGAEILTSISAYSTERIKFHYNPGSPVYLFPMGLMNDDVGAELPVDQNIPDQFILYVSRFEERKNHASLLRAMENLIVKRPGLKLVLVGFDIDGTLAELEKQIEQNGLENSVVILSGISDIHLRHLYQAARAVVYPSFCEGFGIPIIESLMLNPNTYFSATTAMAEFDFASENMFDPYDDASILKAIEGGLTRDPESPLAGQMRDKFGAAISKRFTWRLAANALTVLYKDAVMQVKQK